MPAFMTHMYIARQVREVLRREVDDNTKALLANVLDKYPNYMAIGSLGPDLPYFGTFGSLFNPNHPLGVDKWSYQLHSKDPNGFPLRLFEIIWKESDLNRVDWVDIDNQKLAFFFGFLTHVAADQIVHPLVNEIAGAYYKRKEARANHKDCEVHQDLYVLAKDYGGKLTTEDFRGQRLDCWCDLSAVLKPPFPGKSLPQRLTTMAAKLLWCNHPCPMEFSFLLQKAFVEAHAVTPTRYGVERCIKGAQSILSLCNCLPGFVVPYPGAYKHLFDKNGGLKPAEESAQRRKYILLDGVKHKTRATYDDYLADAIKLALTYVKAGQKLFDLTTLDDAHRRAFLTVVRHVDLGTPLDTGILETAADCLARWDHLVEQGKSTA